VTVEVRWVPDRQGQDHILRDPNGPVGQYAMRLLNRIQNRARELSPVDTGLMRSRIEIEPPTVGPGGLEAAVVARTNYALFVHDGTSRMPARPFLHEAAVYVMSSL
jgi:HK97 gp10 family phage protein